MKRIRLMLTLLAVLCGMTAWAQQTFEAGGISYGFANNERTILQVVATSQEGGYSGAIVIPATVQVPAEINNEQPTLPVARINKDAFKDCTALTSITIGSNVTFLGTSAFEGCTGLTSVTIPDGVVTIGDKAFQGCTELTEVTIGSGVEKIENYAFKGCTKLSKAVFASIESLCGINFASLISNPLYTARHLYVTGSESEVTELTIPSSVTDIKNFAFANAASLTSVTIPASVSTIGKYAFTNCSKLGAITIPEGVTTISEYAFSGCQQVASITIGSGVTTISNNAFANCYPERVTFASMEKLCNIDFGNQHSNPLYRSGSSKGAHLYFSGNSSEVKEITIPEGRHEIKKYTFAGASYLERVNIPASVEQIGLSAFTNCSGLVVANFASIEQVQTMQYANADSNPLQYATTLAIAGSAAEEVVLSDDVSDFAFKDCQWLKKVTLNEGVTSIGKGAFQNCKQLAEVVINTTGLAAIGEAAFYGCISLKASSAFAVPETVASIGKQAFRACRFKEITIPASATTLGEEVFMGCSTLETVHFYSEATAIPLGFFNGCSKLTTFALPASVTTIGERAFSGCSALTDIPMSGSLTTIGKQAFENCTSLAKLVLKDAVVTEIYDNAFSGCSSLTSVSLPATLQAIGSAAFLNCQKLRDVYSYKYTPDGPTPVASENSFGNSSQKGEITLHVVSDDAKTAYENTQNWQGFKAYVVMGDHTLTFIVNDNAEEPFHTITLEEGTPIDTSDIPVPDGGIFSGWSPEVPSIMPNEDRTFYGYTSTQQEIGGIRYHLYPDELQNGKTKRAVVIAGASGPYTHENLVIPAEVSPDGGITSYPVVAIDAGAFEGCEELITIALPNSITEIGNGAFKDCSKLLSVNIPENVTVISENLFMGCKSLPTITWNNKTQEIQSSAFRGCTTLEVSTLPSGIRKIGSIAFGGCENIKEMVIPATLTEMGSEVFLSCKFLKKATFEEGFTLAAPAGTFRDCASLEDVTLRGAMKNVGEKAFYYCVKLKTLVVPEGIQTIGNSAFEGCIQLSNITLPNTLQVLGDRAFALCQNIKQLTIDRQTAPAAPTTSFAAELATNKEKARLYVPAGATGYNQAPWTYFVLETRVAKQLTYIVDDGVGTVDGTAEGYPKTYTVDVMIGDKIEPRVEPQDGDREFSGWTGQPDVMPAEDVTVTGKFKYEVKYYEKFAEGESAEDHRLLGDQEFRYFYGDDTVEPTEGLTRENQSYTIQYYRGEMKEENLLEGLGTMPAGDVNAVVTYTLSEDFLTVGNIRYKVWVLENRAEVIESPDAKGAVVIPQSVTYEEKEYPVTAIHESAFYGLQAVTGMTLPEGLVSIGKWAFRDCRFTAITIPESVTAIDDEAFLYCQKLESVDAEKSALTALKPRVFQYCTALKSIKLPAGLETIGEGAFQSCGSLAAITIPQSVTYIDRNAFFGCIKLATLVVPNGVTAIGEMAFFNCTQLSSILLPESLESIDKQAFAGCLNISQVTVNRATPPTADETSFDEKLQDSDTDMLYVPAVEAYTGKPWSYFTIASLAEKVLTYIVDDDPESAQTQEYKVGEKITPLESPEKEGREFSGWKELPDVMPADALTVHGYFKYQVKYAFAEDSETEGITLPEELSYFCKDKVKLSDILEDMPQRDNYSYTYTLTPAALVAEGSDGFDMPAQDVTVTVRYTLSEIMVPGDANNQFVNYKVWILENERHAEVIASPQATGAVTIPAAITYEGKQYPVTAIQDQAFRDCVGITGMTLSEGLKTIGKQAFRNCRHKNFTTLTIPSTVTEIGEEAFRYCMSLQTVDASSCQVTALPNYVFQQCEALNSIQLPAALQTIGEGTFLGCNALVSITFPTTVTTIAQSAFSMCYNIGTVNVQSTTMPAADELSFENAVYANAKLTVPEGVVIANLPSPWNKFGTIQAGSEASSNQCPVPTIAYNKGKLIFASTDAACTIVYDITVDDAGKKFGTNQGTETKDLKKVYRITAYARKPGMANSTDAVATITWQNGSPVFTGFTGGVTLEEFANPRGDVNGDNIVNIADVTAVINIINGK